MFFVSLILQKIQLCRVKRGSIRVTFLVETCCFCRGDVRWGTRMGPWPISTGPRSQSFRLLDGCMLGSALNRA